MDGPREKSQSTGLKSNIERNDIDILVAFEETVELSSSTKYRIIPPAMKKIEMEVILTRDAISLL